MNTMETFKVKDLRTNELYKWSLEEVLYVINLGHSDQWTLYTADDWKEGWANWVEGCGWYSMEMNHD
jgi:hypothetical protein